MKFNVRPAARSWQRHLRSLGSTTLRFAKLLESVSISEHHATLQDNIFEWHFAIRGPPDTEFEVRTLQHRAVSNSSVLLMFAAFLTGISVGRDLSWTNHPASRVPFQASLVHNDIP